MLSEDIIDKGSTKERYQKELQICPECHHMSLEKEYNVLGLLCCLSTWWICGLGCVFCKLLRSEFCHNCYKERFLLKAHERRRFQLYMDDRSLCEPPLDIDNEQNLTKRYITQPGK